MPKINIVVSDLAHKESYMYVSLRAGDVPINKAPTIFSGETMSTSYLHHLDVGDLDNPTSIEIEMEDFIKAVLEIAND